MRVKIKRFRFCQHGSILVLVVVMLVILLALGTGLLTIAYGVRHRAAVMKNEAVAMLAAEAGYEKAIFWMSQQQDMLSALKDDAPGTSGSLQFADGDCDYNIEFYSFIGYRPIYRVISNGHSGVFNRTVDVFVVQAIGGWESTQRIITGTASTIKWPFATGEVIDIPIHVNKHDDDPDRRDIYIIGSPQFLRPVAMGESRYTDGGSDKYSSVMSLFDGGIYFDQPDSKITDEASVQSKIDRFKESTKPEFTFTPVANAPVTNPQPAVGLEFLVEDGVGKVRIVNNCTVRGFQRSDVGTTYDYKIKPGTGGTRCEKYDIYAYHLRPQDGGEVICPVEETYVTQSIGGVESEPGGQIFIDGNVVICRGDPSTVKGKVTVVATGNIWVADSVVVDGPHDADGKPSKDNPNVLGLVAQGVIKVIDPGMSDYSYVDDTPVEPDGFEYVPIGWPDSGEEDDSHKRHLPDPMVVEAAMTVGGGGWGAENVGERKNTSSSGYDQLVVRGTISEASRGIVGTAQPLFSSWVQNGYKKYYYLDERLLRGILPGDIWFEGKYIPAPAGWHDYRPSN